EKGEKVKRLANASAFTVGLQKVLAASRGHAGRGREFQAERGGGDDLGKPVDLPRPQAVQELEIRPGMRQAGAAADGADLKPGEADRQMEPVPWPRNWKKA